jgi:uncharacterized membrane protein (DUF2068 family)
MPRVTSGAPREVGLRLIVLYKAVKALVELALAAGLVVLAGTGELATLRELAHQLREDVASRWSLLLGRALAALVSERGVHVLEIGLALDAVLSAVEAWSLWRGYRWGPWLVVAATSLPLPLEAISIARARRPWRIALAAVNVAVIFYLVRLIARRRDRR